MSKKPDCQKDGHLFSIAPSRVLGWGRVPVAQCLHCPYRRVYWEWLV